MESISLMEQKDVLPIPFLFLKICGVWRPLNTHTCLRFFYDTYTVLMVILTEVVVITEILCIAFGGKDQSQLLRDNIYIIGSMISGWFKMLNFLNRRAKVIYLTNLCVAKEWNPPRDKKESLIINEYNNSSRSITITFAIIVIISGLTRLLKPIFTSAWVLPEDAWYPCNMSLPSCFWTSYVHQSVGYMTIATIHIANECLISGFMQQICSQLDVLSHRVLSIPVKIKKEIQIRKNRSRTILLEKNLINDCINNHNAILKFSELLTDTFIEIVFIQFGVSLSVICTTVYLLAQFSIFSFDFLGLFLYLFCILIQVFLYCWYGNQVLISSLKFFQTMYKTEWIMLESKTQKLLILMMVMASSPIQVFKGAIIKVNLNAFIDILKLSYSIFSILQNS